MPAGDGGPLERRDGLSACAHAAGLRRRAAAAERPRRLLHRATATSIIADARSCPASQQARFTAAKPSESPKGPVVNLAEEADYDDAQARLAGIQRLLVIAGLRRQPDRRRRGPKTQAALAKFLNDRKLAADAASGANFFDTLLDAARNPEGVGFSWCNDTNYTVMAALGIVEMGAIVTRGWYRVEAGQCVRPDVRGDPRRLYSYAEAVDANGRTVKRGERRSPGAARSRCARATASFELADHKDCAARGLNSAGFAVDRSGRQAVNDRALQGTVAVPTRPLKRRAASATSRPGCSISTTRSIRIISISGSRWTSASATTSPIF